MYRVKWTLLIGLALLLGAVLHYSLPSRDVVRITGHEVKRMDVEAVDSSGDPVATSRDVSYIYAVTPEGEEIAYRNEDTDWGWPPYLKFDTADISSRAANLVSSREQPEWVVVKHYGWRINMLSMFENVVAIRPADGPDEALFPYSTVVMLVIVLAVVLMMRHAILSLFELLGLRRPTP